MNNRKIWITLLLLLALAACNLPRPSAAVDQDAVGTITALTLTAFSASQASLTPTHTETPAATPTVTATFSAPVLYFDGATNCRGGPGTEYDVVALMKDGDKAEIIYRSPSGNYWVINGPRGKGPCWVAGDFVRAEGSYQSLQIATVPPVPTARPPAGPSWKSYNYTCDFAAGGSSATVSLVWSDHADNEAGYNVYRNNQLVTSLGADTSSFTDVAFVGTGQSLSYYIEAYNNAASVPGPVINITCN